MKRTRLIVALAVAFAATACSADAGPGPLAPPQPGEHAWATYEPVGHTFTDGMEILELPRGSRPAVIDSVKLLPGKNGAGLKLVGVRLAGPSRNTNYQKLPWPPRAPDLPASAVEPADGATITSQIGAWELLLGIKVARPGYLARRGIEIDYHIGDQHYSYVIHGWLGVCTQAKYSHFKHNCPPPKASGFTPVQG